MTAVSSSPTLPGAAIDSIGISHDLGARGLVIAIRHAGPRSHIHFDHDLMALVGKFAHGRRHDADAVFVVLGLLRHADQYGDPLCAEPGESPFSPMR